AEMEDDGDLNRGSDTSSADGEDTATHTEQSVDYETEEESASSPADSAAPPREETPQPHKGASTSSAFGMTEEEARWILWPDSESEPQAVGAPELGSEASLPGVEAPEPDQKRLLPEGAKVRLDEAAGFEAKMLLVTGRDKQLREDLDRRVGLFSR